MDFQKSARILAARKQKMPNHFQKFETAIRGRAPFFQFFRLVILGITVFGIVVVAPQINNIGRRHLLIIAGNDDSFRAIKNWHRVGGEHL